MTSTGPASQRGSPVLPTQPVALSAWRRKPSPTTVDVGDGVVRAVRAPAVSIGAIVVGALATAAIRMGQTRDRLSGRATSDAIDTGVGAEVGVEGPVLLHDDDDVADLVDPFQRLARA